MTSYSVTGDSVAWQVMDDEAVVINTDTSDYFSLNATGTFLWQLMAERPRRPEELVRGVAVRYGLSEDDARPDVEAFLAKLAESTLVAESPADAVEAAGAETPTDSPADPYEPPDLVRFGDLETLILSGE